jgi:hypothetical protein
MNIYKDGVELDIKNITFNNFKKEVKEKKDILENQEIDFNSIHKLKGDKHILEVAFQNIKKEYTY